MSQARERYHCDQCGELIDEEPDTISVPDDLLGDGDLQVCRDCYITAEWRSWRESVKRSIERVDELARFGDEQKARDALLDVRDLVEQAEYRLGGQS